MDCLNNMYVSMLNTVRRIIQPQGCKTNKKNLADWKHIFEMLQKKLIIRVHLNTDQIMCFIKYDNIVMKFNAMCLS